MPKKKQRKTVIESDESGLCDSESEWSADSGQFTSEHETEQPKAKKKQKTKSPSKIRKKKVPYPMNGQHPPIQDPDTFLLWDVNGPPLLPRQPFHHIDGSTDWGAINIPPSFFLMAFFFFFFLNNQN